MVGRHYTRNIKARIKMLIFLALLAGITITFIQINWLKNSYQINKEKIIIDATQILDEAILEHKEIVAAQVRKLLIKTIRPQDLETKVFYVDPKSDFVELNCRTVRKPNASWITFNVPKSDLEKTKKNPYQLISQKIKTSDLDRLKSIYSRFVGIVHYVPNSVEDQLQDSLMRCFYFHEDTAKLKGIAQERFNRLGKHLAVKAMCFKGFDKFFNQKNLTGISSNGGDERIFEVSAQQRNRATLTTNIDSLKSYINHLNENDHEVYVAKPILDDIDQILSEEMSIMVLKISVPFRYILWQMSYIVIGSLLSLLLVVFCLVYMLYLILRQKKLSDIKDDFISNVSHELKTPVSTSLAAIQGLQYFEILKDKNKTDQYLETAAKEMKRLSVMIDTILNNVIYERNGFEICCSNFNFKVMLTEIVNIHQIHSRSKVDISLIYNFAEVIFADKTHLYQVFSNLIDNAIKYGKEEIKISIICEQSQSGIMIKIIDNGIGISKKYQAYIFDSFFRVPKPNDHSIKGHGLGLSYVKTIIEKHQGRIALIKSDDHGSIFEINLPQWVH
jgi:signal transduction histidine kinase